MIINYILINYSQEGDDMEKLTKEQLELLENNLPFVTYVAKKYFSKTDYKKNQDILQEGIFAMAKAIPNYNPEKGKITTYMFPTLDGHLKRYVRYQDRLIPIPHQKHLKEATIAKAEQAKNVFSLDLEYKSNSDKEPYTLLHVIPDKKTENLDEAIVNKIVLHDAIINELNWKEKVIIIYRFYFDLNQTMIGELMDISQVHVHRLEKRALGKIKNYITK
jgi:RNA polymerase sigma factor (sigma-70 family)